MLVDPVADRHLFNLIGTFYFLQTAQELLINEIVLLEQLGDRHGREGLAKPIDDCEQMLTHVVEPMRHTLGIVCLMLGGEEPILNGDILRWFATAYRADHLFGAQPS